MPNTYIYYKFVPSDYILNNEQTNTAQINPDIYVEILSKKSGLVRTFLNSSTKLVELLWYK